MLKAGTIVLLVLFILTAGYSIVDIVAPWFTLEGDFRAVTGGGYEGVLVWLLAGLLIPVKVFFGRKAWPRRSHPHVDRAVRAVRSLVDAADRCQTLHALCPPRVRSAGARQYS